MKNNYQWILSYLYLGSLMAFSNLSSAESINRALITASRNGDVEKMKKLLDEGADPASRRIYETANLPETTALREAIRSGNPEALRLLLRAKPSESTLVDAMPYLPGGDQQPDPAISMLFVTELLDQELGQLLRKNARYIRSEKALRKILDSGPILDPLVVWYATQYHSWETVSLLVDRLPDVKVLITIPEQDERLGLTDIERLPIYFLDRAKNRLHEEPAIAEMISNLTKRGLPANAWGEYGKAAAKLAVETGLWEIAASFNSGEIDKSTRKPMADHDRLASALVWGDSVAVERLQKSGAVLRGDSRISAKSDYPRTIAQKWVGDKQFERFAEFGVKPDDWTNPEDDPYLAAKDIESVKWLLGHGASASKNPRLLSDLLMFNKIDKSMLEALVTGGAGIIQKRGENSFSVLNAVVLLDSEMNRVQMAQALMNLGADPSFKDFRGKSAIQHAEETLQLDVLAVLDPGRTSAVWKKYHAKNPALYAGVWSNEEGEFKTVTVILFETGVAELHGAVIGASGLWHADESGDVHLEIIEGARVYERKISATLKLSYNKAKPKELKLKLGDELQILKRVMDGPALEKLIETNQKKSQEKPVNSPAAPPVPKKDDPDEARKRGLETIRKKPNEVFLENWPDETLPQDFIDPKLNGLRIRGGGLRRLPSDLSTRFPNLSLLMIENVSLERIPENFEKNQSLKRLTLTKTGLTGLPEIQLVGINFLDLTDNHIPSIPAGWLPSSLETCNFSNNRLKKFSLKGMKLPVLEDMDLSANSISELELGDLPKIDRLNLSENQLKILPTSIGLCMNLEYLSLEYQPPNQSARFNVGHAKTKSVTYSLQ
jgi:hypothetical protein